jgi:hypothetical protein
MRLDYAGENEREKKQRSVEFLFKKESIHRELWYLRSSTDTPAAEQIYTNKKAWGTESLFVRQEQKC